ncbi:MAG: hypothetical protein A2Y38_02620 [Spirochaetes bacterium GWB1_59_5]|nr:MAG: hypothetical protein A2Y38_02620 [Spirochaetes bacterium GWB1_59_5]
MDHSFRSGRFWLAVMLAFGLLVLAFQKDALAIGAVIALAQRSVDNYFESRKRRGNDPAVPGVKANGDV